MKSRHLRSLLLPLLCAFSIHFIQAQNECLTIQLSSETGEVGDTVAVDVVVTGFEDLIGMQYTVEWDVEDLNFLKVDDFNLENLDTSSFGPLYPASEGFLIISWVNVIPLDGASLPDGTVIYRMYFEVTNAVVSPIRFERNPAISEFTPTLEEPLANYSTVGCQIVTNGSTPMVIEETCVHPSTCFELGSPVTPTVSGGMPPYTYLWTGPNGFSSTTASLTGITINGYYTLKVEDSAGHYTQASFGVSLGEGIEFESSTLPDVCTAANTGQLAVTVTTPGNYAFNWSNGATTSTIHHLAGGPYDLTITNTDDGCTWEEDFEVIQVPDIQITPQIIPVSCEGSTDGQINLSVQGIYSSHSFSYLWSNGATTKNITNLAPGLYDVTVTDITGCSLERTYLVDVGNGPYMTWTVTEGICLTNHGRISLGLPYPETNYDFLWSTGDTTKDLTNLPLGTYTVTVTKAPGCSRVETFELNHEKLQGYLWSDCISPGEIELYSYLQTEGIAPYTYAWSTGDTTTNSATYETTSISVPEEGTYSLTITDDSGVCSKVFEHFEVSCPDEDDLQLYFGPEEANLAVGDEYCVEVRVDNFTNVMAFQFTINWNPEALQFNSLEELNLVGLASTNFGLPSQLNDPGKITVSWIDAALYGNNLADSTSLFKLCFTVLATADSLNFIHFSENPASLEFTSGFEEEIIVNTHVGVITISESPTPVWPGDTDLSERVDQFDLFNIGLAYGEIGPLRPNASLTWAEQGGSLWTYATPNSAVNATHIDTDGNGIINENDVLALNQNYGEVTNFWDDDEENRRTPLPEALTMANPILMVEPQTLNPGQTVTFNILLGDENIPAEDIYGLAFTVVYDPVAIVGGSLSAGFINSWLGNEEEELITLFKDRPEDHRLDIALCRTNHENLSGQGAIAQINLTIADLIQPENYSLPFEIENPRIINAQEELIPVVNPISFSEVMGTTGIYQPDLSQRVSIYPIPTSDILHIQTDQLQIEMLEILGLDGKVLQHSETDLSQISTAKLPAGSYILQVNTNEGMLHKRFVKL